MLLMPALVLMHMLVIVNSLLSPVFLVPASQIQGISFPDVSSVSCAVLHLLLLLHHSRPLLMQLYHGILCSEGFG